MISVGGKGDWRIIEDLLKDIPIPRMVRFRQLFPRPVVADVVGEVRRGVAGRRLLEPLKKGGTVAIAVGSRGITNQPLIVKTLVEEIRRAGGLPFIVPAMGSHAGASAEGQTAMLRGMGFTEEYTGAPIRATMDTVELGTTAGGMPVLMDRYAHEADGLVIINRIKPHVCFRGPYESGLMKMITIGLGKQRGADIAHNLGFGKMPEHIPEIARAAIKKSKLLFAVGLIENPFHETCRVVTLRPEEIETEEPKLLAEARELCPKLHFDSLDALIIDEIGKDISGSGFDTNVVGRYHSSWISGGPVITRLLILDISEKSKGNGNGLGMADFTTQRAAEKFDFTQTYPNTLTATLTGGVKIPMVLPNDRQAIQACIKTSNLYDWNTARIVRIRNTLLLDEIEVSENMLPSLVGDSRFEIAGDPFDPIFNAEGNLF
ncbi:MAG: lactate racemase domain-containing protein [Treponemataceae bacterium]